MKIIKNRYQIIEKLGEGGMGSVYLVKDRLYNNQQLALKTIRQNMTNTTAINIFKQEFEVMTRLKHPNLTQVYDFGYDLQSKNYYLTMDFIEGSSLKEIITDQEKISFDDIPSLMVVLLRTVEFIHNRNILHRDIKPDNIIITGNTNEEYQLKITDFGLADLGKIEKSQAKGTLPYMAPEILKGEIDHRIDIYALGVIFYELVSGQLFYQADETQTILHRLQNEDEFQQRNILAIQKLENESLQNIIAKMIAYHPSSRYESCAEVILAINHSFKQSFPIETKQTRTAYVGGAGFVGRQTELSYLRYWLETGYDQILLIYGDAGVGKSRLLREFKHYCQLQQIYFIEGISSEHIKKSYHPFISILSEILLTTHSSLIEKFGGELKKLLPDHPSLQNITANPVQTPQVERKFLIQNIVNFLFEYSYQQKNIVVIHINDIQWADNASLETLTELSYKMSQKADSSLNLRLYISSRGEGIALLEPIKQKERLATIELRPFDEQHVTDYMEAIFGKNKIDESLYQAIPLFCKKVGGNPFFLQELIKSLVEKGIIIRRHLKWELIRSIDHINIPSNLKSIIETRLNHLKLNHVEQTALQFFALLDGGAQFEILEELTQEKINFDLNSFFQYLKIQELVTTKRIENGIIYRFAHDLIREIVIETIQNPLPLHQHVAETLEKFHQHNLKPYIDALAYHYSQTNLDEKALHYLKQALQNAEAIYANTKSIRYCDEISKRLGDDHHVEKIDVLIKKGHLLHRIGDWNAAIETIQMALQYAEEQKNHNSIGHCKNALGWFLDGRSEYETAFNLFEEALGAFTEINNKEGMVNALKYKGTIYWRWGDYEKAMACFEQQLALAQELNHMSGIGSAYGRMALVYRNQGKFDEAMRCLEEQLRIAEELNHKGDRIVAMGNMGMIYQNQGDYEKAMSLYEKNLMLSEMIGDKLGIGLSVSHMGSIHYHQGNYNEALKCYRRRLKIAEELGDKRGVGSMASKIAEVFLAQGHYCEAKEWYEKQLQIANMIGHKYDLIPAMEGLGSIHAAQGNYSRAMEYYQQQLALAQELGDQVSISNAYGNIGQIYWKQSDHPRAMEYYQKQLDLAQKMSQKKTIAQALGHMGIIYDLQGEYHKALEYHQKKAEIAEELGDKKGLSEAIGHQGSVLWKQGNLEQAVICHQKRLELAKEIGDKQGMGAAYGNMGLLYYQEGSYDEAMRYCQKHLMFAQETGDKQSISIALGNMGAIHRALGNTDDAMEYYQQKLKISEELGYQAGAAIVLNNIANLYLKLDDIENAIIYSERAIELGRKLNLNAYLPRFLNIKAELHFVLNQYDDAINLNDEAKKIVEQTKQKNATLFNIQLLNFKIEYHRQQDSTKKMEVIEKLKKMLSQTDDISEKATINYELYRFTKDELHGKNAFILFQQLYKTNPVIDYKETLESLSQEGISMEESKPHEQRKIEKKVSVLLDLTRLISANLHLEELLNTTIDVVLKLTEAERGFLMLKDDEGLKVKVARHIAKESLEPEGENFQVSQSVIRQVLETGEPLCIRDISQELILKGQDSIARLNLLSVMVAPLRTRTSKKIIGVIYVDSQTVNRTFQDDDIEVFMAIANQAAVSIENATLYHDLEQVNQELVKLDEMKSKFINLASHELRTPLTVVTGYLDMLERYIRMDMSADELISMLHIVKESMRKLNHITNTICDLAQLSSPNPPFKSEETSLNQLVQEIEQEIRLFAEQRKQNLAIILPPYEIMINIDRELIWQALINLLLNAIRYTPDKGNIKCRCELQEQAVLITISDTGIGIPQEEFENIFEQFYEVGDIYYHSSGGVEFGSGGLGIGLSLAKYAIELHGGRIWLESTVGEGSTFYFTIPLF